MESWKLLRLVGVRRRGTAVQHICGTAAGSLVAINAEEKNWSCMNLCIWIKVCPTPPQFRWETIWFGSSLGVGTGIAEEIKLVPLQF